MGLAGQSSHREVIKRQTALSPPIPQPTNHPFARTCAPKEKPAQQMRERSKAQEQQGESRACRQWARERPNDVLVKARARQEAEQRKLAQQECEQRKIHLPAAKPGNLYPGPTRIPGIPPPTHTSCDDHTGQIMMSEQPPPVPLKFKMASGEACRKYKERKERMNVEQRKAALSIPRPEATRIESVQHLLTGVNKALEQKAEAAEVKATETLAFRAQLQQPHKGPEDAYEVGLKCGVKFWDQYDRNHPVSRESDDIRSSPSLGSASAQPLATSPKFQTGANVRACHPGVSRKEVPLDSSRTSDLRAAVEAIDRTSGDLLGIPKIASDQEKAPLLEPSVVSISGNREKDSVGIAGFSLVTYKDHPSILMRREDAPPRRNPWAEQTDMDTESKEGDGSVEDAVKIVQLEEEDIHLEWEEVDDSLGEDGWSDVEQDFVNNDWTGSTSSSDLE